MNTAFDQQQFEMLYPDGIENHYWFSARNFIIKMAVKSYSVLNEKIIEIGCGKGIVVKYLNDNGFDSTGYDLAVCKPCDGADALIFTGVDALEVNEDIRQQYTTLMLLDVLEHIEHPQLFLNQILEKYINLKKIIITVPARQEIWSDHDVFNGHFRRYDLDMTIALVNAIEFKIEKNTYCFQSLYNLTKFLSIFKINRKTQIKPPLGILKIVHRVLSFYLIVENLLAHQKQRGSSIICIATRPEL
jgi:hypothetical protein